MAKMMFNTPVEKTEDTSVASPVIENVATQNEFVEPQSALAIGLPAAWSIEPPAVVVRRKVRTL